jgi:hypothetical protein
MKTLKREFGNCELRVKKEELRKAEPARRLKEELRSRTGKTR